MDHYGDFPGQELLEGPAAWIFPMLCDCGIDDLDEFEPDDECDGDCDACDDPCDKAEEKKEEDAE